ncbi:hypothetical protein GCM10010923_01140 [Blastomonas marina]|uniref:PilZ domain-containing protein n=1 Tax=Blastomonas marina TaxID=1867408 RepID=A0ABQ1F1J5_9SPHN|nr:PilZ domain-containing protein [Blastomonas marina]GFZ97029.1 hypothetical protein GCM10010923_01140 [Blastomonas marina]
MDTSGVHHNSEDSDVPADARDQRGAERLRLLMRTGKLVTPKGEFLCVLRDASTTGFRAKIYHKLPDAKEMQLELASELCYDVEKMWENESEAGFRFAREIELEELINELTPYPKRGVRLKLALETHILVGIQKVSAKVFNLSQQGARIETQHPLARDQRLRLEIKGLRTVAAQVRWRKGDTCGLVFDDTFRFDELALLASQLQRGKGSNEEGSADITPTQIEATG